MLKLGMMTSKDQLRMHTDLKIRVNIITGFMFWLLYVYLTVYYKPVLCVKEQMFNTANIIVRHWT